ncbi:OmpH family outer membrane protein [Oxalicibacterium flavum]|uniref:OmpH family outer membrane protein n=1 Tax=Oxalicibacterium flavum TaxID=179467 RepID=UPI00166323B1|nr:OmpH family outer membrane protein [Oxalicibacterium flavum]
MRRTILKATFTSSVITKGAAVMLSAFCLISPAQAQESAKIGFISTERVFREAAPYKAAQARLEQEFSRRQKELQDMATRLKSAADKFDKDAPVLSESDRVRRQRELSDMDRDLQRRQREFQEDLSQRRNEETAGAIDRTNKVIKQIAEAEKFDIVLQEAAYVSNRIDITDKVIKALAK